MKALLVVAFAAFVASANAKAASILEKHPIDWYDCGGQKDGNYEHPTDCNRFISCSGGVASERDCAICHVNPQNCPDGRLVYNSTVDECLWADETSCGGNGGGNPPTTSEQPITPPPTEATPPSNETTTGATEATTTPGSIEPPTTPRPGDACDPEDCRTTGDCQTYWRCNKTTSKWESDECGHELFWNTWNSTTNAEQEHGGNCDIWANLRPETQERYRKSQDCLACFWEEIDECNSEYRYQPANLTHRNPVVLKCPANLIFSLPKETCQRCEDVVRKSTGGDCCT